MQVIISSHLPCSLGNAVAWDEDSCEWFPCCWLTPKVAR
jgi:hypothetical protein